MQSFPRSGACAREVAYAASFSLLFIAIASALMKLPSTSFPHQTQPLNSRWVNSTTPSQWAFNSLIRLNNGEVLGVGANPAGVFEEAAIVRIYDPVTDSWRDTTSLNSPRRAGSAFLLFDGRVLVLGGFHKFAAQIPAGPPLISYPANRA